MNDLNIAVALIEDRREFLRSLAEPRMPSIEGGRTRQRLGQLVIRFGKWVEGRCPDVTVERTATPTYRSA